MSRKTPTALFVAFAALFLLLCSGCGSGAGHITTTFTPNYLDSIVTRRFPTGSTLTYAVVENNTIPLVRATSDRDVRLGAEMWKPAIAGRITLTEVDAGSSAAGKNPDIAIHLVSINELRAELTKRGSPSWSDPSIRAYTWHNADADATGVLTHADVYQDAALILSPGDTKRFAGHEIGHALGIFGHSPHSEDLMHSEVPSPPHPVPTTRDLNTMASIYAR